MEGLRLIQTAFEECQQNQLSGDDNGCPMESTPTVSVNEKSDPVRYLRSCEIYVNGSDVANPQVVSTGDETRAHKKLDPVEMYWRSREIYESECIGADMKNTPVVDVSVEDPLDVSMEGDDGPAWDKASEFSVETRPSDCVSVNLWERNPVYVDRGEGSL